MSTGIETLPHGQLPDGTKIEYYRPLIWDPDKGIDDLGECLAEAQGEFEPITLDKTGKITYERNGRKEFYTYEYSSLGNIIRCIGPALSKSGIARLGGIRQEKDVVITSALLLCKGQWIANELGIVVGSADPKKIGSAISYGRRYTLSALVGIASEEDDDADAVDVKPETQGDEDTRRRGGKQGERVVKQKQEAIDWAASVHTYDEYEAVCLRIVDNHPKAVMEDEMVRAKLTAAARASAAYDLTQAPTKEALQEMMDRYPKSTKEAEQVLHAHAEALGEFDAKGDSK